MCIEYLRSEVVSFLAYHDLFSFSLDERMSYLYENGLIDEQSSNISKKQIFNNDVFDGHRASSLFRNKHLENRVKAITGRGVKIIDYLDECITGVSCVSCGFVVFENHEDSIFELCPVCGWQSDSMDTNGYSKLNDSHLTSYRNEFACKNVLSKYEDVYVRK